MSMPATPIPSPSAGPRLPTTSSHRSLGSAAAPSTSKPNVHRNFRIGTLAVRDPSSPGRFLLGVECDGATYHSSKSARDRDILRQQVLEGLGWTICRIWSTDWFRDP